MSGSGGVGFFGKLPGAGDFVQRRLPATFVTAWDGGFEAAVDAARALLGPDWHAAWRQAPVWRFALAPGVCGTSAWVGVTGPSVDRVQRAFPMVLAGEVADEDALARIVRSGTGWFEALEQVHAGPAMDASVTVETFDREVSALSDPRAWLASLPAAAPALLDWSQAPAWRLPWRRQNDDQLGALLATCLEAGDGCLWWTRGGPRVPASVLATRGLPSSETYAAFLDASLQAAAWQTRGTFGAMPSAAAPASLPVADMPSVAADTNWDDVLGDLLPDAAPDAGPVVEAAPAPADPAATGVVRHCHDALALIAADNGPSDSRRQAAARVKTVLAEQGKLADMHAIADCLHALHPLLRERGEDLINPVPEDAAVLVTRVAGDHAELLRVGSAVAWHWRNGRLQPLFAADDRPPPDEDDTVRPGDLAGVLASAPMVLAPGLGAADELHCDQATCTVVAGDRLVLLATDALVQVAPDVLAQPLGAATAKEACARIALALGLGGDNTQWPLAVIEVGA